MSDAQVLPFRRPDLVVFERFDPDDMAAMFRAKRGKDSYVFTLLSDGALEEAFIECDNAIVATLPDLGTEQREHLDRYVKYARDMMRDQLATWHSCGPSDRMALLIEWGNDIIRQLQGAVRAAADHDAIEYSEEIALMCMDIETQEAYVAGLETARSLL